MDDLFVPAYPNGDFAVGGGSSTKSYIRAFDNLASAQRSAARLPVQTTVWNNETHKYDTVPLGTPRVVRYIPEEWVDFLVGQIRDSVDSGEQINGLELIAYIRSIL